MANQVEIATEKNLPRGSVEPVSHREVGSENKGLLTPTQDKNTNQRRAKYGETPAFNMDLGEQTIPTLEKVNDMPTPKNPTMRDYLYNNQFTNRHMSQ